MSCDLGRSSQIVVVIKLRRTSAYNVQYQDGLGWRWHVAACRRACVTDRTSPARSVNLTATPVLGGMTGRCIRASLGSARNGRLEPGRERLGPGPIEWRLGSARACAGWVGRTELLGRPCARLSAALPTRCLCQHCGSIRRHAGRRTHAATAKFQTGRSGAASAVRDRVSQTRLRRRLARD